MKKEFYNPVKIEFGRHSLDFLPRYIKARKALLITSKSFISKGIVEKVLCNNPNIVKVISDVQPNPTIEQVLEIRKKLDYQCFEVIIALGGGSVIDVAKAVAPIDPSNNLLEILTNGVPSNMGIKPIIAIPTTAGTGSEMTMWGTIWDDINKKKHSIMDERLYCEAAILDPVLHLTIPYNLTVQTGLDALSHSLESIWNKNNNPTSTFYAKNAITEIIEVLPLLAKDLENIHYRERMLLASYRAGVAFSNTQTALAHAMSYYMTLNKGIPHGIATSFTLPAIAEVAMKNPDVAKKLVQAVGDKPVESILTLLNILGVSVQPKDYNLTKEDWKNIVKSLNATTRAGNSIVEANEVVKLLAEEENK